MIPKTKLEILRNELEKLKDQKNKFKDILDGAAYTDSINTTDINFSSMADIDDIYDCILKEMEDIKDLAKILKNQKNLLWLKNDDFKEFEYKGIDQKSHHEDDGLCNHDFCGLQSTHFLKLKIYGIPLNILTCARHAEQLEQMYNYYEGLVFEDITENGIPIIPCIDDGNQTYFYCRFCQKIHYHGTGSHGGHRVAHCNNQYSHFHKKGYYLKVVEDVDYCYGLNEEEKWIKSIFPEGDLEYYHNCYETWGHCVYGCNDKVFTMDELEF